MSDGHGEKRKEERDGEVISSSRRAMTTQTELETTVRFAKKGVEPKNKPS